MYKFNLLDKLSILLVLIGALNWGIKGLTNYDLVCLIFRVDSIIRIIYILIGVAAINIILLIIKIKSLGLKWHQK